MQQPRKEPILQSLFDDKEYHQNLEELLKIYQWNDSWSQKIKAIEHAVLKAYDKDFEGSAPELSKIVLHKYPEKKEYTSSSTHIVPTLEQLCFEKILKICVRKIDYKELNHDYWNDELCNLFKDFSAQHLKYILIHPMLPSNIKMKIIDNSGITYDEKTSLRAHFQGIDKAVDGSCVEGVKAGLRQGADPTTILKRAVSHVRWCAQENCSLCTGDNEIILYIFDRYPLQAASCLLQEGYTANFEFLKKRRLLQPTLRYNPIIVLKCLDKGNLPDLLAQGAQLYDQEGSEVINIGSTFPNQEESQTESLVHRAVKNQDVKALMALAHAGAKIDSNVVDGVKNPEVLSFLLDHLHDTLPDSENYLKNFKKINNERFSCGVELYEGRHGTLYNYTYKKDILGKILQANYSKNFLPLEKAVLALHGNQTSSIRALPDLVGDFYQNGSNELFGKIRENLKKYNPANRYHNEILKFTINKIAKKSDGGQQLLICPENSVLFSPFFSSFMTSIGLSLFGIRCHHLRTEGFSVECVGTLCILAGLTGFSGFFLKDNLVDVMQHKHDSEKFKYHKKRAYLKGYLQGLSTSTLAGEAKQFKKIKEYKKKLAKCRFSQGLKFDVAMVLGFSFVLPTIIGGLEVLNNPQDEDAKILFKFGLSGLGLLGLASTGLDYKEHDVFGEFDKRREKDFEELEKLYRQQGAYDGYKQREVNIFKNEKDRIKEKIKQLKLRDIMNKNALKWNNFFNDDFAKYTKSKYKKTGILGIK